MGKNDKLYWQRWQKLLEAAANFQEILTGSVMIGGSAAAVYLKHRFLFGSNKGPPSVADCSACSTIG